MGFVRKLEITCVELAWEPEVNCIELVCELEIDCELEVDCVESEGNWLELACKRQRTLLLLVTELEQVHLLKRRCDSPSSE